AVNLAVVLPVVPLASSLASNKATVNPLDARRYAVVIPVIPPPATATSTSRFSCKCGYFNNSFVSIQYDVCFSGNLSSISTTSSSFKIQCYFLFTLNHQMVNTLHKKR